jgi:hypothetical protein
VGAHHFGQWSINMQENTLTVEWDGWDNNTARAYDLVGEIHFYDSTTGEWRTTFKQFMEGNEVLII